MSLLPPRDEAMATALGEFFVREFEKPLLRRIEQLEQSNTQLKQRIIELEAKGVEYAGTYQRAVSYRRGSIVTFGGHMHCAVRDTQPGEQPLQHPSWQLCLKGYGDKRTPTAARSEFRS
jgi:hypothetical protein